MTTRAAMAPRTAMAIQRPCDTLTFFQAAARRLDRPQLERSQLDGAGPLRPATPRLRPALVGWRRPAAPGPPQAGGAPNARLRPALVGTGDQLLHLLAAHALGDHRGDAV